MRSSLPPAFLAVTLLASCVVQPSSGAAVRKTPDEIAWTIHYDPKTLDPAKVDEQAAETVRFLTAGVLLRVNRQTRQIEPELAASWNLSPNGRVLTFRLRDGLRFSDGAALTARDVAWSIRRVLSPAIAAPVAEEFLAPAGVMIETPDPLTLTLHLPQRIVGVGKLFDEIAIEPAERPSEGRITSGPFTIAEYKRGQFLLLRRNPNYWRRDAAGVQLPYLATVRLDVVSNRDQETSSFQRGDYDLIDSLSPEYFGVLARRNTSAVRDLGPSLNTEQMWFNQAPAAPLPDYEKAWFQNRAFRIAISQGIHRADLARIAYSGHATSAYGFISPANKPWYNATLVFPHEDVTQAAQLLAKSGFHTSGDALYDAQGHRVAFSILTNAGNNARQKMATLIQQDLGVLGIQVSVVTLDFPALIERLMHKQDYEACLLGLSNVDPDPNSMMNLWLSSSPNHQWNPSEKTPATPWEAEIDQEMRLQATSPADRDRKQAVDRVQQIVADQQPFIYLVHPNTLVAVSPLLTGVQPSVFQPGLVWNIASIRLKDSR
jgi:peptide/nickel transport system substrate-binding protein